MNYASERGFGAEKPLATTVQVNGAPVWSNVDFYTAQGGDFRKALQCVAEAEAKDGEIVVRLRPERKTHPSVPLLNGIEIEPL